MKLILASQSPRRKELLEKTGASFTVKPSQKEEIITKEVPSEVVMELAYQKAEDIAFKETDEVCVIGSDTVVAFENHILGKPKTEEEAYSMLKMLQGKTHQVYTGVSIILTKSPLLTNTFYTKTEVSVYPMEEKEIEEYIKTGEPMDKAGAYGIQGLFSIYVEKIEGDYNTVVGFPIAKIYQEMKKLGIDLTTI